MGLFDKLLGRGNSANNDSKDISVLHEEKALADMSDIEKAIAERGNFDLSKLKKIPLTNVAAIGGVFAQAVPMIHTISRFNCTICLRLFLSGVRSFHLA